MLAKVDALIKSVENMEENRELFFRRINMMYPTLDPRYQRIERIYNLVKDAFRDDFRDGGVRYFEHLRAVTLIMIDYLGITDPDDICAGLGHDLHEDKRKQWPIERMKYEFGHESTLIIQYVSKPPKEEYPIKEDREAVFFDVFRNAPRRAVILKLADVLHNMRTIWECEDKKRLAKIHQYENHYRYYARREIILMHELDGAWRQLLVGCPT